MQLIKQLCLGSLWSRGLKVSLYRVLISLDTALLLYTRTALLVHHVSASRSLLSSNSFLSTTVYLCNSSVCVFIHFRRYICIHNILWRDHFEAERIKILRSHRSVESEEILRPNDKCTGPKICQVNLPIWSREWADKRHLNAVKWKSCPIKSLSW